MSEISIDSSNNVPNIYPPFLSLIAVSIAVSGVAVTRLLDHEFVDPCYNPSFSRAYDKQYDESICIPFPGTYAHADTTVSPETFPKVEFSKSQTHKITSKTAKIK